MRFEDWLRSWFDRPDSWDFISAEDLPDSVVGRDVIAYATRLFSEGPTLLAAYSDCQVGNGLYALINEIGSPLHILRDLGIPLDERVRCLRAIQSIYKGVFTPRCLERLGHLSEPVNPLNKACYMWWDVFPIWHEGFAESESTQLNGTILYVLEQALALPNAACQESALHGLGHWHSFNPDEVKRIIESYLASGKARRDELIDYAETAAEGMVN